MFDLCILNRQKSVAKMKHITEVQRYEIFAYLESGKAKERKEKNIKLYDSQMK